MTKRRKAVPIRERLGDFSDKAVDGIAIWAVCVAFLLAPLVFDGWMSTADRMVEHAIGIGPHH